MTTAPSYLPTAHAAHPPNGGASRSKNAAKQLFYRMISCGWGSGIRLELCALIRKEKFGLLLKSYGPSGPQQQAAWSSWITPRFLLPTPIDLSWLHQLDAIFSIFGASDRDKRLILQSWGLLKRL
jgi:hypothetical protein